MLVMLIKTNIMYIILWIMCVKWITLYKIYNTAPSVSI